MDFGLDINKSGIEFINLYSKENPILNINDDCYFLLTNLIDYHRPLVCQGKIIYDKLFASMNKVYFVKLEKFLESPNIIDYFFIGKSFQIFEFDYNLQKLKNSKLHQFNNRNIEEIKNILFKVDAFFIRNTEDKIFQLRDDYCSIIKKDLSKQIMDLNFID